jgi:flagellar motor switch protein FliN/FliY
MIENAFNTDSPGGATPDKEGEVIDTAARTRPRIHSADAAEPEMEIEALSFLSDVPLRLNMVLGEATMSLGEVIALEGDSIVQLNKPSGDPVDIFLENQKLGTGEVIVLHEKLRIRLLEVTSPSREKEEEKVQDMGARPLEEEPEE